MTKSTLRNFGFIPKFESKTPLLPSTANATVLAKWYNSVVDTLNEITGPDALLDSGSRELNCISSLLWNRIGPTRAFHPVTPKDIQTLKFSKTMCPLEMYSVRNFIQAYETEVELQKPEYDDLRKCYDYITGLTAKLQSVKDSKKSYVLEVNTEEFENVKRLKEFFLGNRKLKITGNELFNTNYGNWSFTSQGSGAEGVENFYYELQCRDGKIDCYFWNGHEYINSGWSNKRKTQLGMSGASQRIQKYISETIKYLNKFDFKPILDKYGA